MANQTYEERLTDFAKEAHQVFEAMNWRWLGTGPAGPYGPMEVPTAQQIYNKANMLGGVALRIRKTVDESVVVREGRIVVFIEGGQGTNGLRFAVEMGMGVNTNATSRSYPETQFIGNSEVKGDWS